MNHRRLTGFLPVAVAVAVLAAACSDDDDTAEVSSASAGRPTTETTEASEASGDPDATESERSREVGETTEGTLGSTSGQLPDRFATSTVPLTLDVTSLQRNGDHVELQMTLTVAVDGAGEDFDFCLCDRLQDTTDTSGAGYDLSGVRLIDQAEQLAYLPIVDSEGICVCTSNLSTALEPGASIELSATFGGLPADVAAVDLEVPGFSTLPGLAIQG